MIITDEQIKAVAVRMAKIADSYCTDIDAHRVFGRKAEDALIAAKAIRDVMGSDADGGV